MRIVALALLLLLTACHKAEYDDVTTKNLITALSNNDIHIKKNNVKGYTLAPKATEALKLKNRNKFFLLTDNLTNMDRALVSHIVLTKLLEPENDSIGYDFKYNKTKDTLISTTYSLNGMKWKEDADGQNIIVDYNPGALNAYWLARM